MKIYFSCYHKTGFHFFYNFKKKITKYDKLNSYITDTWSHKSNSIPHNIDNVKIIHLIRHPYEIICSGFYYHKKCEEHWCVDARGKTLADGIGYNFEGLSYQQKLNSLNTEEGLNFEIRGRSYNTIVDMYNSRFNNYDFCLNIKMEDLISNYDETIETMINFIDCDTLHNINFDSLKLNKDQKFVTNTKQITNRYEELFTDKNYTYFNKLFSDLDFTKYDYGFKSSIFASNKCAY